MVGRQVGILLLVGILLSGLLAVLLSVAPALPKCTLVNGAEPYIVDRWVLPNRSDVGRRGGGQLGSPTAFTDRDRRC